MVRVTVNRDELVKRLAVLDMGLSRQSLITQSSCYVFRGGRIWTFNGEVVCCAELPSGMEDVECAVPADEFRDLLSKFDDEEEIRLESREIEDGTELIVLVGNCQAGIRVQTQDVLPVSEIKLPGRWSKMPDGFAEAVEAVEWCASKSDSATALSCLHITRTEVEATDGYQAIRYKLDTGLESDVLVKKDYLVQVCKLGMSEWAVGKTWVFFRNSFGLVVGCRVWNARYPNLSRYFEVADESRVIFPSTLLRAIEKAEVFVDPKRGPQCLAVNFEPSGLVLQSEGPSGWYEERMEASYPGVPWTIFIAPQLLREICSRSEDALVGNDKLLVKSERFEYVSACRVY